VANQATSNLQREWEKFLDAERRHGNDPTYQAADKEIAVQVSDTKAGVMRPIGEAFPGLIEFMAIRTQPIRPPRFVRVFEHGREYWWDVLSGQISTPYLEHREQYLQARKVFQRGEASLRMLGLEKYSQMCERHRLNVASDSSNSQTDEDSRYVPQGALTAEQADAVRAKIVPEVVMTSGASSGDDKCHTQPPMGKAAGILQGECLVQIRRRCPRWDLHRVQG
jgi:hypothetical protein